MMLRLLPSAAALAVIAAPAPALAQGASASEMAERMRDPETQEAMSEGLRAATDALLGIRLGPLLRAMEAAAGGEAGRVDPDTTLRDYAGPEAERLPDEMASRLPGVMGAVGEMAGTFEEALPMLRGMAEDMRARIEARTRE